MNIGQVHGSVVVHGDRSTQDRDQERAYLAWLSQVLAAKNLGDLSYVALRAGLQEISTFAAGDYHPEKVSASREQVRRVRQQLRLLRDEIEGGEGSTARLAAAGGSARVISDVSALLEKAFEPVIILGDPGSGKSTTLREVAIRIAQRGLLVELPVIPIYLQLGAFRDELSDGDSGQVMSFVAHSIPDAHRAIREALPRLASANRLLILFDGMDEMERVDYSARVERLSTFANDYRGQIRCLFACRTNDYLPSFRHRQIVLMPFDERQVRSYIQLNLELPIEIDGVRFTAKALARKLLASAELGDAATNPLTLFLIRYFVERFKRWPVGRSELFATYVSAALERLTRRLVGNQRTDLDLTVTSTGLAELAFAIARLRGGIYIEIHNVDRIFGPVLGRRYVEHGLKSGLLTMQIGPSPDDGESADPSALQPGDSVGFFHHRIQEYLCAQHLVARIGALEALDWDSLIDNPRWQETLLHVVAARGLDIPPIGVLASSLGKVAPLISSALSERKALEDEKAKLSESDAQLELGLDLEGEILEDEALETRKREVEARTKAVGTRLDEIKWPLSIEKERTAANRSVLAARLVAEPRVGAEQDEHQIDGLASPLRAAVTMLARHGRPTSQVKMLWAWRDARGAIPLEAIEPPLRSEIGWVRDQALLVFGALAPSRRDSETKLMKELEYDFANGSLLKRTIIYLKASKGRVADTCLIIWALLCVLAQAGLGAGIAFAALFYSWKIAVPETWQIITPPLLGTRIPTIALVAALLLVASFALSLRGTINWSRWLSTWSGRASFVILGIGYAKHPEIGAFWPFTVLGQTPDSALPHVMMVLGFAPALLTNTGFIVSTLFGFCLLRVPAFARDRKTAFTPPAYAPLPPRLIWEWLTAGVVFIGISICGIDLLINLISTQTKVLLATAFGVILAVWFLAFVIAERAKALLTIAVWVTFAVMAGLFYVIPIVVNWLFFISGLGPLQDNLIVFVQWVGFVIGGGAAILLPIVGVITLSVLGYEPAKLFMRANLDRLAFFPYARLPAIDRNRWTETEFVSMLQAATVYRQASVLASIRREQLGLRSSRDLLATLERCEPFIGHEPALGTYWRRRHELEEAISQEMDSVQ